MLVRKNKGIAVIEIIIAMFLFCLFLMCIFTFQATNMSCISVEKEEMKGVFVVESMKNIMVSNYDYKILYENLTEDIKYINSDYIKNQDFKKGDMFAGLSHSYNEEYPFVEIQAKQDEHIEVLKIIINYHIREDKNIKHVFYKGNY